MNIQNSPYLSALQQTGVESQKVHTLPTADEKGFGSILNEVSRERNVSDVRFSKHAQSRLSQRGIRLSDEQMRRLAEGMDKASGKGIKEPLVLIDNLAFIVSTDKKTVITAMGQGQTEENVFTNIDGAVIN